MQWMVIRTLSLQRVRRRAKRIQSTNVDDVIGTFDQDGDHLDNGKTASPEQFDAVDGDPYAPSPSERSKSQENPVDQRGQRHWGHSIRRRPLGQRQDNDSGAV